MSPQHVLTAAQQALYVLMMVSAPITIVVLIVGLIVSIVQAATQINEPTLSFVPKLVAALVALIIAGPWLLTTLVDYLQGVLRSIPSLVR